VSPAPLPGTARDAQAAARLIGGLRGNFLGRPREREIAAAILARWPHFAGLVRDADRFHSRAAVHAVLGGARAVVLGASGYPLGRHGPPVHHAAMAAAPEARFTYASADPVIAKIRAGWIRRAGEQDRVRAACRRLGDVAGIIADAGGGAIQVQMWLCAQWFPAWYARTLLAEYGRLLAPGSSVAVTWISAAAGPDGDALLRLLGDGVSPDGGQPCRAYRHGREDMAAWLDAAGLALIDPPGITDVRAHDQQWADRQFAPLPGGTILELVATRRA